MRNMRVGKRARLARYSAHCDRISAIATADAAIITPEPAGAAAVTASFPAASSPPSTACLAPFAAAVAVVAAIASPVHSAPIPDVSPVPSRYPVRAVRRAVLDVVR